MRHTLLLSSALLLVPARAPAQLQPADATFWEAAGLALAGTAAADPWLRRELRGPGSPAAQTLARTVQPLGLARTAYLGLGASFVAAELARRPGWAGATLRVAAGFVAADAVTAVLKPLVGRARPYVGAGAYAFRAFASTDARHSFPSGHATHAFALAAGVADETRRPWVAAAAYGTAALVGWSRVHDDQHWTSDVVAGAVVGTAAGLTTRRWLERRFRRRPSPPDTLGASAGRSAGRADAPAFRVTLVPRGVAFARPF